MRPHHPILVEQGEFAVDLEDALDHEHHVRPAGIVLVEDQRRRVLQRPGQQAFAKLGHLYPVSNHDRVFADQVNAADVAVEVDANAGPVEASGHLLDVGRFAGAVIALDHHPAVVREACENGQRGVAVEVIRGVDIRDMVRGLRKRRNLHVGIDAESLADGNLDIRHSVIGDSRPHLASLHCALPSARIRPPSAATPAPIRSTTPSSMSTPSSGSYRRD